MLNALPPGPLGSRGTAAYAGCPADCTVHLGSTSWCPIQESSEGRPGLRMLSTSIKPLRPVSRARQVSRLAGASLPYHMYLSLLKAQSREAGRQWML